MSPSVRSTPGIRDAAPALYNYVCSVLQQDSDPSPTNPGHSVLPSDMAPRTNIISARLSNSPEEARVSVGTGTQGGTTRGSPPTVGGSFSVDSGGSFSVGNIGQSLPGIVSVSGGVTPETMTGLPTLAPVISGQPRLHSDSPGRGIVEGCLLTPGTRPNSLPQPQVSVEVTGQNGCDNTPLGDPGRALGQPEVKTASPEPAMAMVWAVDGAILGAPIGGPEIERQGHRGGGVKPARQGGCAEKGGAISGVLFWEPQLASKIERQGHRGGGVKPGRQGGCAEKVWCYFGWFYFGSPNWRAQNRTPGRSRAVELNRAVRRMCRKRVVLFGGLFWAPQLACPK